MSPFRSAAQARFMYSHPDRLGKKALKEWSDKTDFKSLPEKVPAKKSGKSK
jgi:hypothetical protein